MVDFKIRASEKIKFESVIEMVNWISDRNGELFFNREFQQLGQLWETSIDPNLKLKYPIDALDNEFWEKKARKEKKKKGGGGEPAEGWAIDPDHILVVIICLQHDFRLFPWISIFWE